MSKRIVPECLPGRGPCDVRAVGRSRGSQRCRPPRGSRMGRREFPALGHDGVVERPPGHAVKRRPLLTGVGREGQERAQNAQHADLLHVLRALHGREPIEPPHGRVAPSAIRDRTVPVGRPPRRVLPVGLHEHVPYVRVPRVQSRSAQPRDLGGAARRHQFCVPGVPLCPPRGVIPGTALYPPLRSAGFRFPVVRTRTRAVIGGQRVEAPRGIEPRYTDLQSVA